MKHIALFVMKSTNLSNLFGYDKYSGMGFVWCKTHVKLLFVWSRQLINRNGIVFDI